MSRAARPHFLRLNLSKTRIEIISRTNITAQMGRIILSSGRECEVVVAGIGVVEDEGEFMSELLEIEGGDELFEMTDGPLLVGKAVVLAAFGEVVAG